MAGRRVGDPVAGSSTADRLVVLERVGRVHAHHGGDACECIDTLPADVREQLQAAGSVT